jgi:predicted nucleic acid-binding protein
LKIFDATSVIAFLSEMRCPESLRELSKYYQLIIPEGVETEIQRSPGREMLQELVKENIVRIVKLQSARATQIQNEFPQLHLGECEAIALAELFQIENKIYILSDDRKARKLFPDFRFRWTEQVLDFMEKKGIIGSGVHHSKTNTLQNSSFYSSRSKKL